MLRIMTFRKTRVPDAWTHRHKGGQIEPLEPASAHPVFSSAFPTSSAMRVSLGPLRSEASVRRAVVVTDPPAKPCHLARCRLGWFWPVTGAWLVEEIPVNAARRRRLRPASSPRLRISVRARQGESRRTTPYSGGNASVGSRRGTWGGQADRYCGGWYGGDRSGIGPTSTVCGGSALLAARGIATHTGHANDGARQKHSSSWAAGMCDGTWDDDATNLPLPDVPASRAQIPALAMSAPRRHSNKTRKARV